MPLKVKGLLFLFLTATLACGASTTSAQQRANLPIAFNNFTSSAASTSDAAPTVSDKLLKVRAMIAARQLPAAVSELEKMKKEMSGDNAVQSVVRTMLIGAYLEQPNHERAKELLTETFEQSKNRTSNQEIAYLPVAGQAIKSAYSQLDRYQKLGFNLADTNLPAEANADLDRWRKLLEKICEQTREISLDERKTADSLAVLEEAAEARSALARDEYEAAQWRNTMADVREMIANAQTKVTDVDGATVDLKNVATVDLPKSAPSSNSNVETKNAINASLAALSPAQTPATTEQTAFQAVSQAVNAEVQTAPQTANNSTTNSVTQTAPEAVAATNNQRSLVIFNKKAQQPVEAAPSNVAETEAKATTVNNNLMQVGSLVEMATRKVNPAYPTTARNARVAGVVKIEVVVDEQGSVAEIKNTEGPELLRRAASDALRRWKFKPATRHGQPVRMTGYVNFNFAL